MFNKEQLDRIEAKLEDNNKLLIQILTGMTILIDEKQTPKPKETAYFD